MTRVGRAVGWLLGNMIGLALLPLAVWDDLQQALADDPYNVED